MDTNASIYVCCKVFACLLLSVMTQNVRGGNELLEHNLNVHWSSLVDTNSLGRVSCYKAHNEVTT